MPFKKQEQFLQSTTQVNNFALFFLFNIGGDLAERVCKPWFELNETKCKQCVQQICRGLAFIHKNNIVHLDIKPFTLVFANNEENSSLKIVDFALAKR